MRILSAPAREAVYAEASDEIMLVFLDIELPTGTFRACNDWADHTRGGNTYLGHPFDMIMPDETEEQIPQITLRISNVDGILLEEILSLTGPVDVVANAALISSPDTTEVGPVELRLTRANWTSSALEVTMTYDTVMLEVFPGFQVNPSTHPAAFQ